MSEPATPARPFYITGGTLKPGEPSYVERRADTELYESLLAGEFCYVLTARQMGKSSLMARTAKRLEQAGVASAIVDLTQIGSERGEQAAVQWYFGIANLIHRQLGITVPLRPWWQERADLSSVQRFTDFFRELVLPQVPGRVVVFVDEIDSTIGLPFADDFFAALRACFNARATDEAFERLTFVLLGVATPGQLIQDPARTPFNIGKRIDLTDFRLDEAQALAPGLHLDPEEAGRRLERVLHWTGGHPYLTQALCRAVRERGDNGTAEESVDPQVEELFLSSRAQREETNLKHARARLERGGSEGRRLLQLYRRVRQGKSVPDEPTSPLFAQLKLAGVVKATDEGWLAVRNRIYETAFSPEWAKAAMAADRGRQLAAATMAAAFAGVLVWYAAFQPRPYKEAFQAAIKDDGYNGAREAYTALRRNPFSRSRATELMQAFWEQRALRHALAGERDESLLCYLKGLELKDNEKLRRRAQNLVGSDYERLRLTVRHAAEVYAIAFNPDGHTIATAEVNTIRFWDSISGEPIDLPLRYQGHVYDMAFSPDGRTLATASEDQTARLWDTRSGRPMLRLNHQGRVGAVAFRSDGRILVTGSWNRVGDWGGTAQFWDARTGKLLAPPLKHSGAVSAVAFSPDGRILLTGTSDYRFSGSTGSSNSYLWDARAGKPLRAPLKHQGSVNAVVFSPNARIFVTGTGSAEGNGTIQLWDALTLEPLGPFLKHEGSVFDMAFSPDGRVLATGSSDDTAQLWDARTGKPLAAPFTHQKNVNAVEFSPDGRTLVTGASDNTLRFWEVLILKPSTQPLQHEAAIGIVALSSDGQTVASVSRDNAVQLWNARTGNPLGPPTLWHQGTIVALVFSPDGRLVATGALDNTARLWDAHTGKPVTPTLQHKGRVYAVALSPDSRAVATGSWDSTVRLWDARTGKPLALPLQHEGFVFAVAFSPDGRTLATGSFDKTARFWDVHTGKPLAPPLQHEDSVHVVAFSPDGRTLATGSLDTTHLWDARSGVPLGSPLRLQDSVRTIAFSPNGKGLFVATDHWLNTYSWDGKRAVPQNSQLLHGFWTRGFRFPSDCGSCFQIVLGDTGNPFRIETLHFDEPTDPPIEGDPRALLEKWQARFGLKFDEQMRPVRR